MEFGELWLNRGAEDDLHPNRLVAAEDEDGAQICGKKAEGGRVFGVGAGKERSQNCLTGHRR